MRFVTYQTTLVRVLHSGKVELTRFIKMFDVVVP
jgi:hypothetical protein